MCDLSELILTNNTGNTSSLWENASAWPMGIPSGDNGGRDKGTFLPWDNPNNIVTKDTRDAVLFATDCVVFPVLTILGVTGSLMSLIVLLHRNMRGAVDVCLAAMAVSDSVFLITLMVRRARCIIASFDYLAAEWFYVRLFNSMFYLNLAFKSITTLLTILITFNRLVAVGFPLKTKTWLTRRRMLVAIAAIYACSFLITFPNTLFYETGQVFDTQLNAMKPYLAPSPLYLANRDFMQPYATSFLITLFRYIPALVLLIMNGCIIVALKRSSKKRLTMMSKSEASRTGMGAEQSRITRMLLVISLIFLITLLPGCAFLLASSIHAGFQFMGTYHNLFLLVSAINLILEAINSSVNFIIYIVLSKTFSATYRELFCCLRCHGDPKTSDTARIANTPVIKSGTKT